MMKSKTISQQPDGDLDNDDQIYSYFDNVFTQRYHYLIFYHRPTLFNAYLAPRAIIIYIYIYLQLNNFPCRCDPSINIHVIQGIKVKRTGGLYEDEEVDDDVDYDDYDDE